MNLKDCKIGDVFYASQVSPEWEHIYKTRYFVIKEFKNRIYAQLMYSFGEYPNWGDFERESNTLFPIESIPKYVLEIEFICNINDVLRIPETQLYLYEDSEIIDLSLRNNYCYVIPKELKRNKEFLLLKIEEKIKNIQRNAELKIQYLKSKFEEVKKEDFDIDSFDPNKLILD